jgi:hypothetical protein
LNIWFRFGSVRFVFEKGVGESAHFSHSLLEIDAPMTLSRLPEG